MTFNFLVNNMLTYRDMRLRGFWPLLRGLISFAAVCALGTLANVGIAVVLFQRNYTWWLAGIAGIFMGAVWNYTATSIFTWHNVRRTDLPAPAGQNADQAATGAALPRAELSAP